jgi:hypothetical protein
MSLLSLPMATLQATQQTMRPELQTGIQARIQKGISAQTSTMRSAERLNPQHARFAENLLQTYPHCHAIPAPGGRELPGLY